VSDTFGAGDLCLLLDPRGRRYLIEIKAGQTFQYHGGFLRHETLIGLAPGSIALSSSGGRIAVMRPRLADYILKMRRGAQVVYPKDIGPIIHWADIRGGDLVLEAGSGSGALTLALLRAVGESGKVVSVEVRPDHLTHARNTVRRFLGAIPGNLVFVEGRVEEVLPAWSPDRLVLDLPEPWEVVEPAAAALAPGGILCAYLPTVPQVQQLHDALHRSGRFVAIETFEMMIRNWKVQGRAVRPESLMVGHTGFITVAHHVQASLGQEEIADVGSSISDLREALHESDT
jgi:tRNA (adenine57-N1/adenine58-N1)-methyltransferase